MTCSHWCASKECRPEEALTTTCRRRYEAHPAAAPAEGYNATAGRELEAVGDGGDDCVAAAFVALFSFSELSHFNGLEVIYLLKF